MAAVAGVGPGRRQEPGASSGSPVWVLGALALGHFMLLSPAGSEVES